MLADTTKSEYAKQRPVKGKVRWTDGFWKEVTESCAENMVPNLQKMFEDKDISHVIENFRICAGKSDGEFDGSVFGDGDFYKWMESAFYASEITGNYELLEKLDQYITLIGEAQQPDGYLSTKQIIGSVKGTELDRMGDINDFEVYNMGHLFTSACLHHRITGKTNFLEIAEKAAGYLQKMYEEAEKAGEVKTAVCPSHYMGLIELYRTTGRKTYLNLARKAIELRDSVQNGLDDNQDRIPLRKHEKIIGHAVRASYLYAGVADLYAEAGDPEYLSVLHKVWHNMTGTKIYLTGGIGALYNGTSPYGNFFCDQKIHQAFGYEYQLPNITAYNETCASIGLVMWAYRMFLIDPKAEYFDIIERAMLNTNLAAVSLDGLKYFYENMLRRTEKLEYQLVWPMTRTSYIISYCCPPNLARTIMQSSEYTYTVSDQEIWCGLYGANEAELTMPDGVSFTMRQETGYPFDGNIRFTFPKVLKDGKIILKLRIPGWAESGNIVVNGKQISFTAEKAGSYMAVELDSLKNREVALKLDMPVRYTSANKMVEEDCGQAAVECGPLVYCMEKQDAECSLDDISLQIGTEWKRNQLQISGTSVETLTGHAIQISHEEENRQALYQTLRQEHRKEIPVRMIPYYAWDNRGNGEMRIWFPYLWKGETQ